MVNKILVIIINKKITLVLTGKRCCVRGPKTDCAVVLSMAQSEHDLPRIDQPTPPHKMVRENLVVPTTQIQMFIIYKYKYMYI